MRRDLRRRLRAWTLLATFVCAFGSSQLSAGHFGIVDSECGDVAPAENDGPRVGVAVGGAAGHCPVCHFLRVVNGAEILTVARIGDLMSCSLQAVTTSDALPTVEMSVRSSRGPPPGVPSTTSCL